MTEDQVGYGQVEFKSVGWPTRRSFYVRMWVVLVLPLVAFASLLDQSFWRDPWFLGFVIVFPLLMTFVVSRMSKGTILLDNEGITQKAGGRFIRLSWADIEGMVLTSIRARGSTVAAINGLAGVDVDKEFIELKLRKSLRINPISENQSTRGWGIPTLFVKVAHLYVDDPRALLEAAEVHLRPGVHA